MTLSTGESLAIILVCAACTQLERFLPFLVFSGRQVPKAVRYLGRVLPMAVIATLVVYCLRSVSFAQAGQFVPEMIAVAVTVGLHLWKRQSLLSIFGGTACYMLLVQGVFG